MGRHLGERVSGLAGVSLLILGITAAAVAIIAVAAVAYAAIGIAVVGVLAVAGTMISEPIWIYVAVGFVSLPLLLYVLARAQPPRSTIALFTWVVVLGFSYVAFFASGTPEQPRPPAGDSCVAA